MEPVVPSTLSTPDVCMQYKANEFTFNLLYTDDQQLVNDAASDGHLCFAINGARVRVPYNILDVISRGFPDKIETLITGFGTQTTAHRIAALQKFIASGGDINRDNGILILTALNDKTDIVEFLFANGARIYNKDTDRLYIADTKKGHKRTAFSNIYTLPENRIVLFKHVFEMFSAGVYPRLIHSIIDNTSNRLQVFSTIPAENMPADTAENIAHLVSLCYAAAPEYTLKYIPVSTELRVRLILDYGIMYDNPTPNMRARLYAEQTKRRAADAVNKDRLVRLKEIQTIMRSGLKFSD